VHTVFFNGEVRLINYPGLNPDMTIFSLRDVPWVANPGERFRMNQ